MGHINFWFNLLGENVNAIKQRRNSVGR